MNHHLYLPKLKHTALNIKYSSIIFILITITIYQQLEDKLNEALNEVLKKLPDDPFSNLCSFLQNVFLFYNNHLLIHRVPLQYIQSITSHSPKHSTTISKKH